MNLDAVLAVPSALFKEFLGRFDDLPTRNIQQGADYAAQGLYRDAIFRLKVALWMAPDYAEGWYLLGHCYTNTGNQRKAITAFKKALALDPTHERTAFLLASLAPESLPKDTNITIMPPLMVQEHFDNLSEDYDTLQRELGYRGHVHMENAVRQHIEEHRTNYRALDLGCGTGLLGFLLGDIMTELDGVDFTESMLMGAGEKEDKNGHIAYQKTYLEDLRDFLHSTPDFSYDFICAAHVFNYVGDLSDIIQKSAAALRKGGYFIFQVEPYRQDFGVIVGAGRFGHSDPYIQQELARAELELISNETVDVYPDLHMNQYIARKAGGTRPEE